MPEPIAPWHATKWFMSAEQKYEVSLKIITRELTGRRPRRRAGWIAPARQINAAQVRQMCVRYVDLCLYRGYPTALDAGRRAKGFLDEHNGEYRFVRIGEYAGSAVFGVRDGDRNAYEDIVHEHARDGWRLVQIFAPGVAAFGAAKYYEVIFEREMPATAGPSTMEQDAERVMV